MFDVATVKPSTSQGWSMRFTADGFTARGVTLQMLVQEAYDAYAGDYVEGGPQWAKSDQFDVQAKLDTDAIPEFQKLKLAERRAMLQALLADRFKVAVHQETRSVRGYVLQIDKNGTKFGPAESTKGYFDGVVGYSCLMGGRGPGLGEIKATNCSIKDLCGDLTDTVASKVVDETGLIGRYNFELHWAPEQERQTVVTGSPEQQYPQIFTAIREQLGLKLVPARVPVKVIVIDRATRPVAD